MARLPLTEVRKKVTEAIEAQRYDDAAAIARVILEAFPKSVYAHRMLGEALWEAGRPEEAAEAFDRVLGFDPEDFVAYAGLALIAEQQGALDRAIGQLQMASELAPNSEEVRAELLRLYEKRGLADSARLKISRTALARIYARGEMQSRAVTEFRAVLTDHPDRQDARLALAEVLWREGQADEARECAETVLQYLPECLKAQLIAAQVAKREGREQHSQQLLSESLLIDPLGEMAERIFGADSPLPPTDPLIQVPDYLLGQQAAGADAGSFDIELPDWLTGKESEPASVEAEAPPPPSEPTTDIGGGPTRMTETMAWLDDLRRSFPQQGEPEVPTAEAPMVAPAVAGDRAGAAWDTYQRGGLAAAMAAYRDLVATGQQLEDVTRALAVIVADTGDLDAMELLGDAYMGGGQYRSAMDSYRLVLRSLEGGR
ncbi:MAG: tetratricopeptide repeat protein [Anaerolineae bacterium]